MEFLTTPDLAASDPRWASLSSSVPSARPSVRLTPRLAPSPSQQLPHDSTQPVNPHPHHPSPTHTPGPPQPLTPRNASTPFYAPVDRAGIKSSFQSLFSPSVAGAQTPALFTRNSVAGAPALTPFINGMQTPNLVTPGTGIMPSYPASAHGATPAANGLTSQPGASPDMLSSPYLQAAAKEAVRREFLNMPTYVAPSPAQGNGEREVPEKHSPHVQSTHGSPEQQESVGSGSAGTVPALGETGVPTQVSPTSGDAKVPSGGMRKNLQSCGTVESGKGTGEGEGRGELHGSVGMGIGKEEPQPHVQRSQGGNVGHQMQPYFIPPHAAQHAAGMMMLGQHGPMMMAPPPGAMYTAPPHGMMMFPGGQAGPFMQPGMMMHAQHAPGQMVRPPGGQGAKAETQAERKQRIENEKQELIREFKKKTREAALVRFRQKRRERRFGKLIRYDCRKKLADARPRVKGRFVRIKEDEDESEGAQVVPDLENQR